MNILYIQQYFKTPDEPGSTRSYWVSKELIRNGHNVTVICHANVALGNQQKKLISTNKIDGIKVISIRNKYTNSMGPKERMWSFFKFMVFSSYIALVEKKIDLVFSSSTPLTVAVPALIRKKLKGTKYIFEVRDLWPEAPIQLGFIKNKMFIKFLKWFEKKVYNEAEHVITLSPGMQEGVTNYINKSKTSMIPNMAKIDQFYMRDIDYSFNKAFGLGNHTFKLIYFGTMGFANGIDYLMKGIQLLDQENISDLEFVFVGEGVMKNKLIELSLLLKNVRLSVLERQPMEIISKLVNNCDVSICTFSNVPILKTNSPNKLFDSLSAGKPSIVNSDGWTKDIIENYECGMYVDPNNPLTFVNSVKYLKNNPEHVKFMGKNARRIAETLFDKSILCKELVKVLESSERSI
ncbi:glycosyltransferase family 4 protein [Sphingobacterium sp. SGL-16]|uniref:glycosyltransferase family 4 protein n=1 Tax=Sphingobacterium sp. SGL-16 TaxID=2710883 RepID=UPI0013EA4650|nr:glycosyltransferase family 4 protein [Sphingobacterium sp. SGL-16]NGM73067.1 glycosyltransferase family 4 protein [Sphingobacterium sp. SGL-16]